MARGRFWVIEGMDGSGKSTQAARLAAALRQSGRPILALREPGATPLGEALRALLLHSDPGGAPRQPRAEALLFFAARVELLARQIGPALQAGQDVLCERFSASTLAYQGQEPADAAFVLELDRLCVPAELQPDRVLILDLPAAESFARVRAGARAGGGGEGPGCDRIARPRLPGARAVRLSALRRRASAALHRAGRGGIVRGRGRGPHPRRPRAGVARMIARAHDLPHAFARALAAAAPADAWILLAPGRQRARAAAWACAGALLKTAADPAAHPDCSVFDPVELGVDGLRVEHVAHRKEEVQSVESALRYLPIAGAFRAVLLLDADLMNADAQGALLKTAEEPPAGTVLLLSGVHLGNFLPALRSRCRILRLGAAGAAELERAASAAGADGAPWHLLREAIGGEAALELPAEERAILQERLTELAAWRANPQSPPAWLADFDESFRGAELRALASHLLQAALGSLLRADPLDSRSEFWADRLDGAIQDLDSNLTPSAVLAGLRRAAAVQV